MTLLVERLRNEGLIPGNVSMAAEAENEDGPRVPVSNTSYHRQLLLLTHPALAHQVTLASCCSTAQPQ